MVLESSTYSDPIETIDRGSLRELQEQRLVSMVAHAYEHQPLTRAVWSQANVTAPEITSLDAFRERAPFITKPQIREFRELAHDPWGGLLAVPPSEVRGFFASSGTTGRPTYTPDRSADGPDTFLRVAWMAGARPGDHTVTWGPMGTSWPELGITTIFVHHSAAKRDLTRLVEVLFEFRPTFIFWLSNPVISALAEYADNNDIDLVDAFSSVRGGVRGGEPAGRRIRELVSDWGLELFDMTAGGDIDVAVECEIHSGSHIWEDTGFIECLDPMTNEPVLEGGRGELVVTSLVNRIGPLIRYRTDDLVEYQDATCDCGRTHARIRTIGRISDATAIGDVLIMPADVWSVVEGIPETAAALFQIVRNDRQADLLRVRVGYAPMTLTGGLLELRTRLHDSMEERLHVPIEVDLMENDVLMQGSTSPYKLARVVNE